MEGSGSTGKVTLPAGVTIGPGRETSTVNAQGAVVQGMAFTVTTKDGSTTTVFIPYSEIHDTAKVQQTITARVNAISAITG